MSSMYETKIEEETDRKLKALMNVGQMVVKQKAEINEAHTGIEEANAYGIFNVKGKMLLKAFGCENDLKQPCSINSKPPFAINVLNTSDELIMTARSQNTGISRKIYIECPEGHDFAVIEEPFAWLAPSFLVKDAKGELLFMVHTPMAAAFGSFDSVKFKVYAYDKKTKLGEISKDWSGLGLELFSDTDAFAMSVPDDMDVKWKTVLLTVLFLIDFTFYEQFS